jgi:S1-C subfamily serine protease
MKSFLKGLRNVIIFIVLLIGLMYAVAQSGRYDYTAPRSTVHAIYGDAEVKSSQGSGVMIAPRLMLTVTHGMLDQPVFVGDLRVPAKVLRTDKEKDLALLLVAMDCPCARIALAAPEIDDRVLAIGYPMNSITRMQVLSEGRYQGVRPDSLVAAISAPLASGNSGGGVFAWDGVRWALIGIASGVTVVRLPPYGDMSMLPHLGSAVSTAAVRTFLNVGPSLLELNNLTPEKIVNTTPAATVEDGESASWAGLARDLAEIQRLIEEHAQRKGY